MYSFFFTRYFIYFQKYILKTVYYLQSGGKESHNPWIPVMSQLPTNIPIISRISRSIALLYPSNILV